MTTPLSIPRPTTTHLQSSLLVGAGKGGKLLVNEMRRNPSWGFCPVGLVDDNPRLRGRHVLGLPVLGRSEEIPAIVERLGIDVVVIAIPSASDIDTAHIVAAAQRSSARILTMPHIGALLRGEARASSLRRVDYSDILGRPAVEPNLARCSTFIEGRGVLITGAAGSIGQELTRQVAQLGPVQLVAVDTNETGLFDLQADIAAHAPLVDFQPVIASVANNRRIHQIFDRFRPEVVFHAAAYKHVPLMETYPEEAVMVNAVGAYQVAQAAAASGVDRVVFVSTDKAVRPSSVMGASKRVAELAGQAVGSETGLSTCSVRFGNVLGSRGSVIPTFVRQIEAGGPITVTHPEMKRYFMTIPEAASLIIQAGAFGDRNAVYILDMGDEVPILQLAERLIRLHGLRVGQDIEIVFTGLRPGEKLSEELALASETTSATTHPQIRILEQNARMRSATFRCAEDVERLRELAISGDAPQIREALFAIIDTADNPALVAADTARLRPVERGLRRATTAVTSSHRPLAAVLDGPSADAAL